MKKRSLLFAALTMLFLVGCQNEEQSKLSLDALGESAVISGQVVYSTGIDTVGTDYTAEVFVPAAGKKVTILVPLSEYKSGSTGTRSFECVVDAEGNFTDTIPCTKNGLNGVTIRLEEFAAQRNMGLEKMEGGKPVFNVRMCRFEGEVTGINLVAGKNYLEEVIKYAYAPIDMSLYDETINVTGALRLPVETAYGVGSYVNAANCDVELTVMDGVDIAEGSAQTFTYGVTTDANGAFKLALPIKSLKEGFTLVDMVVMAKSEKAFKHFKKDGSSVNFTGAYMLRPAEDNAVHYNLLLNNLVKDIDCNVGSMAMRFIPNYNNNIAETVLPAGWNEFLAGWMLGWADFADYTETITLSGQVMMAKETAFGVGTYVPASREMVTLSFNGSYPLNFVELPTDENGYYSVVVPVMQASVKPFDVTVYLNQPESIEFVHFTAPDKSRTLKAGSWYIYNTLRGQDADWNLLGTTYCKFNPAESLDVNTFASDLLGWYKNGASFVTPTISGTIKLAKEDEFAKGSYVNADGLRVRISLGNGEESEGETVVVPLNNGAFSFEFPIATENKKFSTIGVNLLDNKELAFAHFTPEKTLKLEGVYETFKQEKGAEWYECGTYYYKFKPNTQEDSYLNYLAGWQVVPGFNASITVTGEVFKAYEVSYAIGAYAAAKDQVVTITMNASETGIANMKFAAPVDAEGKFSIVVPLEQNGDILDYRPSVSVDGAVVKDFVHYKDNTGAQCNLKGEYKNPVQISDPKAANNELGKIYFKFTPNGENKESNIESFDDNLAGWYVAPFGYNKGNVFTGIVMKPKEDGFWKGSYSAFANQKINVYDQKIGATLVVLTDNEGKYSYQSYKEKEEDKVILRLSLNAKQNKEDAFVHYVDMLNSKPTTIEGTYAVSFPSNWEERGANMGTTYLAFTPKSTPQDWASDLFGWQQVKFVEPGKSKATAKFQLYAQKAIETTEMPHAASWTDAGKQKVKVEIINASDWKSYSFSTLSSGKSIQFNLPWTTELEGSSSLVTVNFICATDNNSSFVHYPILDEETSQVITGNWKNGNNIKSKSVDYNLNSNNAFEWKESAKLLFQPKETPAGWANYNWNAIINNEIE